MPHEKDRPAGLHIFVEPGELSARERNRHQKGTPTTTIPVVAQQQQRQPQPRPVVPPRREDDAPL